MWKGSGLPTLKRWGLSIGHTTNSCTRRFARFWPAMSSHETVQPEPASRISLHTISRICGSNRCRASGSSPSGPEPQHHPLACMCTRLITRRLHVSCAACCAVPEMQCFPAREGTERGSAEFHEGGWSEVSDLQAAPGPLLAAPALHQRHLQPWPQREAQILLAHLLNTPTRVSSAQQHACHHHARWHSRAPQSQCSHTSQVLRRVATEGSAGGVSSRQRSVP